MVEISAHQAQYTFKVAGQTFQVLGFDGYEEVSHLFRYTVTLWKDNPEVPLAPLLRKPAEIIVRWGNLEKHYYGLVAAFTQIAAGRGGLGGAEVEYGEYRAEVVPTLWILGEKANCRIFQELSADRIIARILDERGLRGKYEARMSPRAQREYCVQYRESDLTFIQRLMEEEGIFYYFTHDGGEKLILCDDPSHWGECTPQPSVRYASPSGVLPTDQEYLDELVYDERATVGKVKLKDYDYRDPTQPLLAEHVAESDPPPDLEVYDYHVERFANTSQGTFRAKVMVQAQQAPSRTLSASGTWRSASAGGRWTLSRAYRGDLDGEWVVLSVTHSAIQQGDSGVKYRVSLVAIPSTVFFRPKPRTQQPLVSPQTATVMGPPGERIYMDSLGRAKVKFHWDLENPHNENTSCWIRVAQPYAGKDESSHKKHGFQWHPLVGDEVVVEFLEGDPDNPLIVGSVYNGENTPIVEPDQLIRNRILTPYQHQLLLDDRGASIRLNTGGDEHLTMVDKNRSEGSVTIETRGHQHFKLEDNDDEAGNLAELTTSGGHRLFLAEKDRANGIMARTIHGHRLAMSDDRDFVRLRTANDHRVELHDPARHVEIHSAGGHKIRLDDAGRTIVVTSTAGARVELNDERQFIELASPTGQQRVVLDYACTGLILEALDGDIKVSAPNGTLSLEAARISLGALKSDGTTAGSIRMDDAGHIAAESRSIATSTVGDTTISATRHVTIEAMGNATLKGTTEVNVEGRIKAKLTGTTVDVRATTIATLKGILVKIN